MHLLILNSLIGRCTGPRAIKGQIPGDKVGNVKFYDCQAGGFFNQVSGEAKEVIRIGMPMKLSHFNLTLHATTISLIHHKKKLLREVIDVESVLEDTRALLTSSRHSDLHFEVHEESDKDLQQDYLEFLDLLNL